MIKVRAHSCYLGKTGYSAHSRSFFRELSKYVDLRVRNYTWDDNPNYLNDVDFKVIDKITLNDNGKDRDYPISHGLPNYPWVNSDNDFNQDVDIVLMDTDHYYFYENYGSKVKIAYTVWESTELPKGFFEQLLKFDYLWVVSEWHKKVAIDQGYPEYKIFVVNEGVNSEFFDNIERKIPEDYNDGRFKFLFFGRWDYRKSVPEIVGSFLKAFPNNEPVDLILSADNPFSVDGMKSTEERLKHYGYNDTRIKVKHFLSREDYISYIKKGNVMITCARSEGWNIPLIEAMAAGTPVIYSNWGAQLEFSKGKGNPVKIEKELPASIGAKLGFAGDTPGLYAEPDYENLVEVLKDCYENYQDKKLKSLEESKEIVGKYNWENIGLQGYSQLLKVVDFDIEKPTKNECVVVLSHADSHEKLSILRRCVLTLKRRGYLVIISSHISVPEDLTKICDYFICESDNPVVYHEEYESLSRTVPIHYLDYNDFYLSYSFDFNHGYAALKIIQNGAGFSKFLGFEKTHFINYDYIIENIETLDKHSFYLEEYDIVSYRWNPDKSINSAFFSAKNDCILKSIEPIKSKKDYFKYEGVVILEDFIYRLFEENSYRMFIRSIEDERRGNIFNSVTIPTYPIIGDRSGKNSYLYLGKESETGKDYICIMGNDQQIDGKIIKNNTTIEFSVPQYPMNFFEVLEEDLERGIVVELPKFNKKIIYNKKTKKAGIHIKNPSLIITGKEKENNSIFNINFFNGPYVEIKNAGDKIYEVQFIDSSKNKIHYSTELSNNTWARCNIKYYIDWLIRITDKNTKEVYEERINLKNKNVLISLESSSLGDSISWFAHVEEFRKKNDCNLFVSTFKNDLFIENYPQINFISPGGSVENIYTTYRIGWFYENNNFNRDFHPRDFKNIPMQSTTTDILGIDHQSLRPKIVVKNPSRPMEEKYVCFGIHSTTQAKYWNNPNGWQELTNWFLSKGFKVVVLSVEEDGYMGNKNPEGVIYLDGEKTLDNAIRYLKNCDLFVGIGSGLSWLSWALEVPTVLISGFSKPMTEFLGDDIIRIFNHDVCNGCFNRHRLDAGDWNWCPDHKGTDRQFECSKSITSEYVIKKIEDYLDKNKMTVTEVLKEAYSLGMVQNEKEILEASNFFKSLNVKNFMEIGTDQGGTFSIWSKLSSSDNGIRISVDLPHGPYGVNTFDVEKRDNYLKSLGKNVTTIHGSSHELGIKEYVKNLLNGDLLDFLFIDGDHTYEGVKEDYIMYKEFVKKGGWIGFHDIKDTEYHRNANCRVDKLWEELQGEKIIFVDSSSNFGGIGFIKNN